MDGFLTVPSSRLSCISDQRPSASFLLPAAAAVNQAAQQSEAAGTLPGAGPQVSREAEHTLGRGWVATRDGS